MSGDEKRGTERTYALKTLTATLHSRLLWHADAEEEEEEEDDGAGAGAAAAAGHQCPPLGGVCAQIDKRF